MKKTTYTNFVNMINNNTTIIKGFVCKPEMIVIGNDEGGIAVITRFGFDEEHNELYKIYVYEFLNGKWRGRWLRFKLDLTDDLLDELHDVIRDIIEAREQALLQAEWESACKEADSHPEEELAVFDGEENEYWKFVDVLPGEKCNNGGEYGFYSSYYPTERKGVYLYITSCSCDFDPCGTGREGFVVLTKDDLARLIKDHEAVLERGCLY